MTLPKNPKPIPNVGRPTQSMVMPVRQMRLAKGWSQIKLSGISGVGMKKLRGLELNIDGAYFSMNLRQLCRLALALGCSPVDLVPYLAVRGRPNDFASGIPEGCVYTDPESARTQGVENDRRSKI